MNKLQYRSSEAPTCWGVVDVPEVPNQKYFYRDITNIKMWKEDDLKYFDAYKQYNEALELALKNWIPIRVEDQEKVNWNLWYWFSHDENDIRQIGILTNPNYTTYQTVLSLILSTNLFIKQYILSLEER